MRDIFTAIVHAEPGSCGRYACNNFKRKSKSIQSFIFWFNFHRFISTTRQNEKYFELEVEVPTPEMMNLPTLAVDEKYCVFWDASFSLSQTKRKASIELLQGLARNASLVTVFLYRDQAEAPIRKFIIDLFCWKWKKESSKSR